jgi:hypothetical protein
VSAPGFEVLKGDKRYRTISQKPIRLTPEIYQDGVEELVRKLEAPDFDASEWDAQPEAMAVEARRLSNAVIAAALEANAACDWDGQTFFYGTHKVNPFKGTATFSNTTGSSGLSAVTLATARANMRAQKAPNGKSMKLRLGTIVVPPELENTAIELQKNPLVVASGSVGAVANIWAGSFEIVVADELSDSNDWYAIAAPRPGVWPWLLVTRGVPKVDMLGKDSEHCIKTGKISYSVEHEVAGMLVLPHCIHRYQG